MKNSLDGLRLCGLLLCLVLSVQVVVGQQTAIADGKSARQLTSRDATQLAIKGRKLSAAEAVALEEKLAGDQQDLETRFTLIGYYSTRHDESSSARKREQALWLIQNIPDSELLQHVAYARLNQHERGFEEAKQLWLKQLDAYKGNLVVLSNAVDFFLLPDKALTEKLLKQGAVADPSNARWPQRLGQLYLLQMTYGDDTPRSQTAPASGQHLREQPGRITMSALQVDRERRTKMAEFASAQFELAYKLAKSDSERASLLVELAKSAFEAGDVERAHRWAFELLSQGTADKKDWNYGNAIHHGHIILGRIALLSGSIAEAKQHLIEAGETPGSPQLNSFGPNMILAKELLEKGERESVIKYFELCASFWKNRTELDQWAATVKGGGIPDFGANLAY